jgi:hypothetical protein
MINSYGPQAPRGPPLPSLQNYPIPFLIQSSHIIGLEESLEAKNSYVVQKYNYG